MKAMNHPSKRTKWLLSSVLAAGITGFAPLLFDGPLSTSACAQSQQDDVRGEKWVKYEDVPRAVQRTLDRARDNEKGIKKITHVTRGDRDMYRAIIDEGGDDLRVWVDRDGQILRQERLENDIDVLPGGDLERSGNGTGDRTARDISERGADRETWVKYRDVPPRVQDTLNRERHGRDLKKIARVERGDNVFYRAIVDDRAGDRIVLVNNNGRLLTDYEVAEPRLAGGRLGGSQRDLDRYNEDSYSGRTRRDFAEGQRVNFDRLPGEVKAAIGREAGSDRVAEVMRYDMSRGDGAVYRAVVTSGNRQRIVRVDDSGRILGARNEAGKERVEFNNLPGPVKTTLGRETNPDHIEAILQETRSGRTEYRARIDEGPTMRWITIDRDGKIIDQQEPTDRGAR